MEIVNEQELQDRLIKSGQGGIALDIDETLSWTIGHWLAVMQELFGNPEGLSVKQMADKYKLAQHVPYWKDREDVKAWMHAQRNNNTLQEELPLIEGALEGVHEIAKHVPVVAYITVRPQTVLQGTVKWLHAMGFPHAPVMGKPDCVDFHKGNEWKGQVLGRLRACGVWGIVDDNPQVAVNLPTGYGGVQYLYGHTHEEVDMSTFPSCVVLCPTWQDVVRSVTDTNFPLQQSGVGGKEMTDTHTYRTVNGDAVGA